MECEKWKINLLCVMTTCNTHVEGSGRFATMKLFEHVQCERMQHICLSSLHDHGAKSEPTTNGKKFYDKMYATEQKPSDELPDHALLCPVSYFFPRFDIHDKQDQTNNNNVLMMGDKSSPCFSRLYELPTSCFPRRVHDICCVAQKMSSIFRVQFNDVRQCWSLTIASQMVSAFMAVQFLAISFL